MVANAIAIAFHGEEVSVFISSTPFTFGSTLALDSAFDLTFLDSALRQEYNKGSLINLHAYGKEFCSPIFDLFG